MAKIAIIPSDNIDEYKNVGISDWLEDYFNPLHFFNEVYLLSPLEKEKRFAYGMNVIPVSGDQFPNMLKELKIDLVRAYGGGWACDMACRYKVTGIPVVVSVPAG